MIADKTRNLFLFIDFLHANIDNFNQYASVILDIDKAYDRIFLLGTHFEEARENKALQKEIHEKKVLIVEKIVNPIKNIVDKLHVYDWYRPVSLRNNHFSAILSLSAICTDEDLTLILKAKKQYIEFSNKISISVIKQEPSLFGYLCRMMTIIVEDFEEKGDMPIKVLSDLIESSCHYFDEKEGYKGDHGSIAEKIKDVIYSHEYKTSEIKNVYARIELFTDADIVAFDLDERSVSTFNDGVTSYFHYELLSKIIEDINILYLEAKIDTLKQMRSLLLFKLKGFEFSYTKEEFFSRFKDEVIINPVYANIFYENEDILRVKTQYINIVVNDINKLLAETDTISTQLPAIQISTNTANAKATPISVQKKQPYIDKEKIDVERLKKYFTLTFLGKNAYKVNCLTESLVNDVGELENGKQIGQLALLIYESKQINTLKPKTFSGWYTIFCECMGIEKLAYKKGRLKEPTHHFRKLFYYLVPKKT